MTKDDTELRALSTVNDSALVKPDALATLQQEVYNRLNDYSSAAALGISMMDTPDGTPFPILVTDDQGSGQGVAENAADRDTGPLSFTRTYLGAHKTTAHVPISSEVMTDNNVMNFMDYISMILAEAAARRIDPLIFNGTGTGQPRGSVQDLRTHAMGANPTPTALHEATLQLNSAAYRTGEKEFLAWGMAKETYHRITTNAFGSQAGPAATAEAQALSDDDPNMLWGYPVIFSDHFPSLTGTTASGTRWGVFGNFKRAVVARKVGNIAIASETPDAFASDQTEVRVTVRFDSRVRDINAARALTVS